MAMELDENNKKSLPIQNKDNKKNNKESASICKIVLSETVAEVVRENHGKNYKIFNIELDDKTTIAQFLIQVVKSFG